MEAINLWSPWMTSWFQSGGPGNGDEGKKQGEDKMAQPSFAPGAIEKEGGD